MKADLRLALRGLGFLLPTLGTGVAAMVALPLMLFSVFLVPLLPAASAALHRWSEWERRRAGRHFDVPVVPSPATTGFWEVLRAPATWRELRWLAVHTVVGTTAGFVGPAVALGVPGTLAAMLLWPMDPEMMLLSGLRLSTWGAALGVGAVQLAVMCALLLWFVPALAKWQARATLRLLSLPAAQVENERLAARVDELAETRAGALEAHGAELRRIERDLHDGAQAQLVALAMRLGIAEKTALDDPEAALKLVREARDGAEEAMAGLRDVVRTLYPPILADRGLAEAVSALGGRCTVSTTVTAGDLGEVPAAVEAAAYFVVAEALTNVAKHSGGQDASVSLARTDGTLRIEITDDGVGGLVESRGTGVAGIRHRVAALDGSTEVDSPVGGPTVIRVALPCGC